MPKEQTVSLDIAPLIPSHRPLMANIATPIGWKIARCSSLGQPRTPHQMVVRMPARPVRPPRMPSEHLFKAVLKAQAGTPFLRSRKLPAAEESRALIL